MNSKGKQKYLQLDDFVTYPPLAQRLPSDVAWRYHALPIAEDQDGITVAMVHPEDTEAQKAVESALGKQTALVQASARVIDRLLEEIFPKQDQPVLKLHSWTQPTSNQKDVQDYASHIAECLHAEIEHSESPGNPFENFTQQAIEKNIDLVICNEVKESMLHRLVFDSTITKVVRQSPVSLITAHSPRRPIKKILLPLRSEALDEIAVNWAIQFSRATNACITVMPITQPAPGMYHGADKLTSDIPAILSSDSKLGWLLRRVSQQLMDWEIEGTLCVREEPPFWQLRCEIEEGEYDLVIIAGDSEKPITRWITGELVTPLLSWINIPVLIAKQKLTH